MLSAQTHITTTAQTKHARLDTDKHTEAHANTNGHTERERAREKDTLTDLSSTSLAARARSLRKKLAQIDSLIVAQQRGTVLNDDQKAKITRTDTNALVKELQSIE